LSALPGIHVFAATRQEDVDGRAFAAPKLRRTSRYCALRNAIVTLICPTGNVREFLSSRLAKNIALVPSGKSHPLLCAIPPRQEGRYGQSSRNAKRDAMDAARQRRLTLLADGKVVWS